jgi:hypothetical protein
VRLTVREDIPILQGPNFHYAMPAAVPYDFEGRQRGYIGNIGSNAGRTVIPIGRSKINLTRQDLQLEAEKRGLYLSPNPPPPNASPLDPLGIFDMMSKALTRTIIGKQIEATIPYETLPRGLVTPRTFGEIV